MKYAQAVMDQMLVYYIGSYVFMAICIVASFTWRKADKTYLYGIAFCILAACQLYFVVPFVVDYAENAIIVQEGEYENTTHGNNHGLKTFILRTEKEEIKLTTALGYNDVFVEGKHYVRAYYLARSRILLHIEMRGQGDGSVVP